MIPKHCSEVSIKHVDFDLTKNNILKALYEKDAYTKTNYFVLLRGKKCAVVEIEKEKGIKLFRKIKKIRMISLPKDTVFIEEPDIDLLNPTAMVEKAIQYSKNTVVIKGEFEHVSFVHKEKLRRLVVVDVVPPFPSKLLKLATKALALSIIRTPIELVPNLIDLRDLASKVKTKEVMFPCTISKLLTNKKTLYLDEKPEVQNVTLLGCNLSLRIFSSLYGYEPSFINMCPKEFVIKNVPVLIRCCGVKEGFEFEKNCATVPWGATVYEVAQAIKKLLGEY